MLDRRRDPAVCLGAFQVTSGTEDVVKDDRLSDARRALSRGDVLIAYDMAQSVLDEDEESLEARTVVALALARSGAGEQAGVEAAELGWRVTASRTGTPQLREDADALIARLAKDDALEAEGAARVRGARKAAELYERVADRYNRSYSCVNAASLWLIGAIWETGAFMVGSSPTVQWTMRSEELGSTRSRLSTTSVSWPELPQSTSRPLPPTRWSSPRPP